MREVSVEEITNNIAEMCIKVCHELSDDMKACLFDAYDKETSGIGKKILGQLKENLEIVKGNSKNSISIDDALKQVDLEEKADKKVYKLSKKIENI